MFFIIPGGGGIFTYIILFLIIRLVAKSLFGSGKTYKHYYYNSQNNSQKKYQQSSSGSQGSSSGQSIYRPVKNYYAVLGLTEAATDDEIKKAYRKLIMEYHPDQIANKGLNDDIKEFATKRFREVQEAYEEICKLRGIK